MDDPLVHFDSAYPDLVTVGKSSRDATDDGTRSPDEAGALTDFDANSACSVHECDATDASAAAMGTKRKRKKQYKPGYNSNKARDERKEALLLLRKQAEELQALRDKLERRRVDHGAIGTSPIKQQALRSPLPYARNQSSVAGAGGSVWKDVAATQYKERQRAEMENIHLKQVLECQLKISRSLEKVLNKRHNERVLRSICDEHVPRYMDNRPIDPDADASIFRELLAGIDIALVDVDQDFSANGLTRMGKPHHDALVHRDGKDIVLEVYAIKMMPFDVASTGQAAWNLYADFMDRLPYRVVYDKQRQNMATATDTIVESFGLQLESSRKTKAITHVQRVMRRFVEPDRVVIAWRAHSEPVEVATVRTDGARLVERGYTVVSKAPDGVDSHSLVKTCYIIRPEFSSDTITDQERKVTAITDFMLDSITHTITTSHQAVENVLIDQALRRSGALDDKLQVVHGY